MQTVVRKKMVKMAEAIGLSLSGNIQKDQYLLSEELLKLTKQLGIKTLSEQGIENKDFDMLAEDVLKEPVLGFNPKQNITKQDILNILKKAF